MKLFQHASASFSPMPSWCVRRKSCYSPLPRHFDTLNIETLIWGSLKICTCNFHDLKRGLRFATYQGPMKLKIDEVEGHNARNKVRIMPLGPIELTALKAVKLYLSKTWLFWRSRGTKTAWFASIPRICQTSVERAEFCPVSSTKCYFCSQLCRKLSSLHNRCEKDKRIRHSLKGLWNTSTVGDFLLIYL
jgi:hypothetical protein